VTRAEIAGLRVVTASRLAAPYAPSDARIQSRVATGAESRSPISSSTRSPSSRAVRAPLSAAITYPSAGMAAPLSSPSGMPPDTTITVSQELKTMKSIIPPNAPRASGA
jgi:hypothetical protein